MKTMKIKAREWKKYFEKINAELRHRAIHIEGDSLASDGQLKSGWARLNKISYDPEFDLCDISVSGLVLQFKRLQDIHLVCGNQGLSTIEIKGTDGVKHIVRFREPLPLPVPAVAMEVS